MRVTLVAGWPLIRSGLRQVLQSAGIGVIASVSDAAEAANVLRRVGADAVVVSALTCHAGVTNTRKIAASDPTLRTLVLGRCADPNVVQPVLDAGARGYFLLDHVTDVDLIDAVRRVAAGELCLSPELSLPVRPSSESMNTPFERLTERERQVLALIANGRSNRQIAVALDLSARAVAALRAKLMKTLSVRQTAALVSIAVRHGLVVADRQVDATP